MSCRAYLRSDKAPIRRKREGETRRWEAVPVYFYAHLWEHFVSYKPSVIIRPRKRSDLPRRSWRRHPLCATTMRRRNNQEQRQSEKKKNTSIDSKTSCRFAGVTMIMVMSVEWHERVLLCTRRAVTTLHSILFVKRTASSFQRH